MSHSRNTSHTHITHTINETPCLFRSGIQNGNGDIAQMPISRGEMVRDQYGRDGEMQQHEAGTRHAQFTAGVLLCHGRVDHELYEAHQ